jgi:hypothetical protein
VKLSAFFRIANGVSRVKSNFQTTVSFVRLARARSPSRTGTRPTPPRNPGEVLLLTGGPPRPLRSLPPAAFGGPGDRWSPETLLVGAIVMDLRFSRSRDNPSKMSS